MINTIPIVLMKVNCEVKSHGLWLVQIPGRHGGSEHRCNLMLRSEIPGYPLGVFCAGWTSGARAELAYPAPGLG